MKGEFRVKSFKLKIDSIDEKGVFIGHGAVFGNIDSTGDVIRPGAFKKSINEQKEFPMLWMHDVSKPLGIIHAEEDERGLAVKGEINLDVQLGREIYSLMKQGAIKALSIGYQTVKATAEKVGDKFARALHEIALFEVSPVVFPANRLATIDQVKGIGLALDIATEMALEPYREIIKEIVERAIEDRLGQSAEPQPGMTTEEEGDPAEQGENIPGEDAFLSRVYTEFEKITK